MSPSPKPADLGRLTVISAMAAATLFAVPDEAAADCTWDSGGRPNCGVDVDIDDWDDGDWDWDWGDHDGDDDDDYDSGGDDDDGGGGDGGDGDTEPRVDDAANKAAAVAGQENAHLKMRERSCFEAVTGQQATSANRRQFANVAGRFDVRGRSGQSGTGTGTVTVAYSNGRTTVFAFDNYRSKTQTERSAVWFVIYHTAYSSSTSVDQLYRACIRE